MSLHIFYIPRSNFSNCKNISENSNYLALNRFCFDYFFLNILFLKIEVVDGGERVIMKSDTESGSHDLIFRFGVSLFFGE